jgi:hypothetical protein
MALLPSTIRVFRWFCHSSVFCRVVREQYCLCSPSTKLEKRLIIVVVTLVVIILVLTIFISILAEKDKGHNLKEALRALFSKM